MLSSEVVCYRVFDEFVCSPRKKTSKEQLDLPTVCHRTTDASDLPSTIGYSQHLASISLTDVLSKDSIFSRVGRKNRTQVNKFSRGSNRKRVTQGSWHMPWRPTNRPPMIPPFGGRPRRRARCFGELWKQLKSQGYRMWL